MTPEHQRQLKLVQREIQEASGEAIMLEAEGLDPQQEALIVERFRQDRDAEYQEFLGKCADYMADLDKEASIEHFTYAELQENEEDLKKLKGWLPKIKALDFYAASAGPDAEQHLAECEAKLDQFAQEVFNREQRVRSKPEQDGRTKTQKPAGAKSAKPNASSKRLPASKAYVKSRR